MEDGDAQSLARDLEVDAAALGTVLPALASWREGAGRGKHPYAAPHPCPLDLNRG
ncbi:hypothetical protein ACWELB_33785 [Streptomyces asiaticus]